MSKQYLRKVDLCWTPEVTVSDQTIKLKTGSWAGATKFECTGELSVYCAASLVKKLRRALRQIRDSETARLAQVVNDADAL